MLFLQFRCTIRPVLRLFSGLHLVGRDSHFFSLAMVPLKLLCSIFTAQFLPFRCMLRPILGLFSGLHLAGWDSHFLLSVCLQALPSTTKSTNWWLWRHRWMVKCRYYGKKNSAPNKCVRRAALKIKTWIVNKYVQWNEKTNLSYQVW